MRPRRATAAIVAAVALTMTALVLTGCTGGGGANTTGDPTASGRPSSPVATPRGSTSTPAADPTCDTIIPQTTVASLEDAGWSSQQDAFYIGETEIPGGLQCTWGDTTVASDHVQIYGWAPISADQAAASQKNLLANGWRQVEVGGKTYITAGPDMIMDPDEQGYGMTYLFGDGAVSVADTMQGLVLVEWPPAH